MINDYVMILFDSTIYSLIIVLSSIVLSILFCYILILIYTMSDVFYAILKAIFTILLCTPATALLLISVFWFGNSDAMKMLFITIIAISYMFSNVIETTYKKEEKSINQLLMMGWGKHKIAYDYIIPISTPLIVKNAGSVSMLMWTYLVLLESVQATKGLGFLLNSSINIGKIDLFCLSLLIIVIISFTTNMLSKILSKYFNMKWKLEKC